MTVLQLPCKYRGHTTCEDTSECQTCTIYYIWLKAHLKLEHPELVSEVESV